MHYSQTEKKESNWMKYKRNVCKEKIGFDEIIPDKIETPRRH